MQSVFISSSCLSILKVFSPALAATHSKAAIDPLRDMSRVAVSQVAQRSGTQSADRNLSTELGANETAATSWALSCGGLSYVMTVMIGKPCEEDGVGMRVFSANEP